MTPDDIARALAATPEPLTPESIRAAVAARPEATIHERAATAAYLDALVAQEAGLPGSVRAGRLAEWARLWRELEAERDAELETLRTGP